MSNLVDLTQLSDTELAEIRERYTRSNLSDKQLRGIVKIAREYKRRGYTPSSLAHIRLRAGNLGSPKTTSPKKGIPARTSPASSQDY